MSVALQADVGNIPSNSVAVLSSLGPLLKALSADNVAPLAVVQAEALGACFHVNGPFASKVPDLLVRSPSTRIERLGLLVGWMAGDTASHLAQTAGGRAIALISWALSNLYSTEQTGEILFNLSNKLLPYDQNHASMSQLTEVGKRLSSKLGKLAFGNHLAEQVTRLRQTYFDSQREYPVGLVRYTPTVESMTDLLSALHSCLMDESTILYIEGDLGMGFIVALITALCPCDTLINVDNQVIFQGERSKIIISVCKSHLLQREFQLETIVNGSKSSIRSLLSFKSLKAAGRSIGAPAMKVQGMLRTWLEIYLCDVDQASDFQPVATSVSELFYAIVLSAQQVDGVGLKLPLRGGLKRLLGLDWLNRLREKIKLYLDIDPSDFSIDISKIYARLYASIQALKAEECCVYGCLESHPWRLGPKDDHDCRRQNLWHNIAAVLGSGVLLLFLEHETDICFSLRPNYQMGMQIKLWVMSVIFPDYVHPATEVERVSGLPPFNLHKAIIHNLSERLDSNPVGISNGTLALFPSTLENPGIQNYSMLAYIVMEGRFCHGGNYYDNLTSEDSGEQETWLTSAPRALQSLELSNDGVHSSLVMTVRPIHDALVLRILIRIREATIRRSFYHLQSTYCTFSYAKPCLHNRRAPLDRGKAYAVVVGSLRDYRPPPDRIAVISTHGDPEAQFLCNETELPTLVQGNSCLNCSLDDARENGFRILLQT